MGIGRHRLGRRLAAAAFAGLLAIGAASADSASRDAVVGTPPPDQTAAFNVFLPIANEAELDRLLAAQTDPASPEYHRWLSPEEFRARFGPASATLRNVEAALAGSGLTIIAEHSHGVTMAGPMRRLEQVFAMHLRMVRGRRGPERLAALEGGPLLPTALRKAGAVIAEFGMRPRFHTHSRPVPLPLGARSLQRLAALGLYFPNDLREAYGFPSFTTMRRPKDASAPQQIVGLGATIAILISSTIDPNDLQAQFNSQLRLGSGQILTQNYSANTTLPVPRIAQRRVLGGSGPFDPVNNAAPAVEASLDTQMSLATAPGATEILYDIPDLSDPSILAGYLAIVEDNRADIVSASFGACELYYTAAYNNGVDFTGILQIFSDLFKQGNAQGITFVAAAGDSGARSCLTPAYLAGQAGTSYTVGVEVPAADPDVTAVGGTNLLTTATPGPDDAHYLGENAQPDPLVPDDPLSLGVTVDRNIWGSGGGVSTIFAKPAYQNLVDTGNSLMRTVPDVSLMMGGCPSDADLQQQDCTKLPRSAALIFFGVGLGGGLVGVVGTSLGAPEMAGVLALAVQLNGGRLGNVNPLFYTLAALQDAGGPLSRAFYHRDIRGNNGAYRATPGDAYNYVVGLGTPRVADFLGLSDEPRAGAAGTPSNP